jgi:hypothetical protein
MRTLLIALLCALPLFAGQSITKYETRTTTGQTATVDVSTIRRANDVKTVTLQVELVSGTVSACSVQLEGRLDGMTAWAAVGTAVDCNTAEPDGVKGGSVSSVASFDQYRASLYTLTGTDPVIGIGLKVQTEQ